jgi:hypothetical protein
MSSSRTRKAARLPLAERKELDRVQEVINDGIGALFMGWMYEKLGEENASKNSKKILASDLRQHSRTPFGDKIRAVLQSDQLHLLYEHHKPEHIDDLKRIALRTIRPQNRLANTVTTSDKQLVDMYIDNSASVSGSVNEEKVERLLHMKNIGRNAARMARRRTRRLHH